MQSPPCPIEEREAWFRRVANGTHWIDLIVRHNGVTYRLGGDWLKHWSPPAGKTGGVHRHDELLSARAALEEA